MPARPHAGPTTAVLLAGGTGTRVGGALPKQLAEVAGRPLMEHPLAVLDAHPGVDEVVVLMAAGHLDAAEEIVRRGGYRSVRAVEVGGATRDASTRRALELLDDDEGLVLLHDAARPLLGPALVSRCLDALHRYDAVTAAVPSSDTVIEVTDDDTIAAVPARARLRRVQTPQGFRVGVLREAHARAVADPEFEPTDDCSVVRRYLPDVPVGVVAGDEQNFKVTEPVDVLLADRLLRLTEDHPPG
jgi:ribitol-5-phosphate 2-dehydrogenase (NADP+) / D-ribitol-5-phosphate cytidylyltransferase